jgi:coenzyme F420-reducing hydrogenase gamma subunit
MKKLRKRLAVFKFASCDGCQLSLLDLEDELLLLTEELEIAYFVEASSSMSAGPYDLTLIEGSLSTPGDIGRIQRIRAESKYLVTIGACANAGGIQALRNFAPQGEFRALVYPKPEYIQSLDSVLPIAAAVTVDYELQGCPINKKQLLELIASFLNDKKPNIPLESVCFDCKRNGTICILVSQGKPCLGPVTQAGCGALCPRYDRACYGCYGPKEKANTISLAAQFTQHAYTANEMQRMFRNFNALAPLFDAESQRHEN